MTIQSLKREWPLRRILCVLLSVALTGCVEEAQVLFRADGGGAPTLGVTMVAAGSAHTCALLDGALWCWGGNTRGELGIGSLINRSSPVRVDAGSNWTSVSTGENASCALKLDGSVWCWGTNSDGTLGVGNNQNQPSPVLVSLPKAARQLSLHFGSVCAVLVDDTLWCWGANAEGQLGLDDPFPGAGVNRPSPSQSAPGTFWRQVDIGQGHACGIQVDGSLWCWGRNTDGQAGLGNTAPGQFRVARKVAGSGWAQIHTTQNSTCAIKSDRTLWCWGILFDSAGQPVTRDVPTLVDASTDWEQLSINFADFCGLKSSGVLWCWGRNLEGQLGNGETINRPLPGPIGTERWSTVAVGRFHRCAITVRGELYCNGLNAEGSLGVGDEMLRASPVPLTFR